MRVVNGSGDDDGGQQRQQQQNNEDKGTVVAATMEAVREWRQNQGNENLEEWTEWNEQWALRKRAMSVKELTKEEECREMLKPRRRENENAQERNKNVSGVLRFRVKNRGVPVRSIQPRHGLGKLTNIIKTITLKHN